MLQITLHSLAFIVMLSAMVLVVSVLSLLNIYTYENSLKQWAIGGALLAIGYLEITVRGLLRLSMLIPIGNALLAMGMGYLLLGIKKLLHQTTPPLLSFCPWYSAAFIFLGGGYCIAFIHSDAPRVALLTLITAIFHGELAWTFLHHKEKQLKGWFKLTVGVQFLGCGFYIARTFWAPVPLQPEITPDSGASLLVLSSAFFTLFFNVWMTTTAALIVSARASRLSKEANEFNEAILSHTPLAMGVYDARGNCVRANEAYAALLGVNETFILAKNYHQISAWKQAGILAKCEDALRLGVEQQIEAHVLTSLNKELWLDCRILPTQLHSTPHLLIQLINLTERKQFELTLHDMAFHDPLTQLPNRRLLMDRINHAILISKRTRNYCAVLYIDLDKFKPLNDMYGHALGDKLLVQMAQRLLRTVRASDTVARLGGDEFVVMLEGLSTEEAEAFGQAQKVSTTIRTQLSEPYQLDGLTYHGTASIGIQLFVGDADDTDEILKQADAAMYRVKRATQGSNTAST